jgi:hypothetical protein
VPGLAESKGKQEANATTAPQPVVRAAFCAATLAPGNATPLNYAQRDTAVRFSTQAWIVRRPEFSESVGPDIAS